MNVVFRKFLLCPVLCVVALTSCMRSSTNNLEFYGTVRSVDEYGSFIFSMMPYELESKGVEYGDVLEISISDSLVFYTPYVDAFSQVGSLSACLCNYNRQGTELSFGLCDGNLSDIIYKKTGVEYKAGSTMRIRLIQKRGYLKEYLLLQGTISYYRQDYTSDEVFANFREISAEPIAPLTLSRSSSPINYKNNPARYVYSDSLCRSNGINTVLDIADSESKVAEYINSELFEGMYMRDIYKAGNIIALNSGPDYTGDDFRGKLVLGLRGLLNKKPPFLVSCGEGKHRTGFYCILLESLAGCNMEQIKNDYVQSFCNLYRYEKGSDSCNLVWSINGYRMLYLICNPDARKDVLSIDWNSAKLDESGDFVKYAEKYLLDCGMSSAEISALRALISGK